MKIGDLVMYGRSLAVVVRVRTAFNCYGVEAEAFVTWFERGHRRALWVSERALRSA
jgi:hypothetical protein